MGPCRRFESLDREAKRFSGDAGDEEGPHQCCCSCPCCCRHRQKSHQALQSVEMQTPCRRGHPRRWRATAASGMSLPGHLWQCDGDQSRQQILDCIPPESVCASKVHASHKRSSPTAKAVQSCPAPAWCATSRLLTPCCRHARRNSRCRSRRAAAMSSPWGGLPPGHSALSSTGRRPQPTTSSAVCAASARLSGRSAWSMMSATAAPGGSCPAIAPSAPKGGMAAKPPAGCGSCGRCWDPRGAAGAGATAACCNSIFRAAPTKSSGSWCAKHAGAICPAGTSTAASREGIPPAFQW